MKANITFIISILAFLLSLYNFIINVVGSIKKISISIYTIDEYKVNSEKYVYQILLTISNKSRLPISITHISVNNILCKVAPKFVSETTRTRGSEVVFKDIVKTIPFPINLSQLSGQNGYIEFVSKTPINKDKLLFDVYTNRGKLSSVEPSYNNSDQT